MRAARLSEVMMLSTISPSMNEHRQRLEQRGSWLV